MNMLATALTPIVLLSAAALQAGEFSDDHFFGGAERSSALKALEGKPAAELQLDAWIGDETSLEELQGNVIIVDFWATWCGPCMAAIPKNIALVEKYKEQGLQFIGVHDSGGGWDKAAGVVADKKINYPVARDADGKSVKAYGLSFWPTYVAIDRSGVVRAAGLLPGKVEDVAKVLLAEPGGPATAAAGEFPADWYVGGEHRPARLASLEGAPAPAIDVVDESEWIGKPLTPEDREGHITIVRFISPATADIQDKMAGWADAARSLSPHGVRVLGVCDPLCDWDAMQALVDTTPAFPIVRDQAPEEGSAPLGRTAAAYGVRLWPTAVVIDRNGRLRAAGIDDTHLTAVIEKLMVEPMDTLAPSDAEEGTQDS
ncbi:MAG: TlpA disulfide reductase family protein [Phycisphaerales bacterium]|jgi:thiol-disulfide isomerase/thioredoxin|nr:TlpA disulfide reductase family protein [Phycisphaerales bacterium]